MQHCCNSCLCACTFERSIDRARAAIRKRAASGETLMLLYACVQLLIIGVRSRTIMTRAVSARKRRAAAEANTSCHHRLYAAWSGAGQSDVVSLHSFATHVRPLITHLSVSPCCAATSCMAVCGVTPTRPRPPQPLSARPPLLLLLLPPQLLLLLLLLVCIDCSACTCTAIGVNAMESGVCREREAAAAAGVLRRRRLQLLAAVFHAARLRYAACKKRLIVACFNWLIDVDW